MEIELSLDSTKFRVGIKMAESELRKFQAMLGRGDSGVRRHERSIRSLGASFRHTIVTLGLLREAMRTTWMMTGNLAMGIIKTAAEFERLGVLLEGMAEGTTQIEKAADAQKQFNQIMEEAKTAPFTVKELTNSWVKFKSVGLDPADGSMRSLVDAVAAFGGTDDILHRATIAVQQMAGKGVISMEELRQQMGEAVPQAMVLLAKGMNMSVGDMVDAISKGTVDAKPALQKLFNEFELAFGGKSKRLMETFTGSVSRLNTHWQLTLKEMGENSGLLEESKRIVNEFIEVLNDPAVRRFAIDVATSLKEMVLFVEQTITKAIKIWQRFGEEITLALKLFVAYRVGVIAAARANAIFTTSLMPIGAGIMKFVQFLGLLSKALWAGVAGTKSLTRAWKIFMLSNPVGWLAAAAGALATWFFVFKENEEVVPSATEDLKRYLSAADPENIEAARQELAALKQQFEDMKNPTNAVTSQIIKIDQAMATLRDSMQNPMLPPEAIPEMQKALAIYMQEREKLVQQQTDLRQRIANAEALIASVQSQQIAQALDTAKRQYGEAFDALLQVATEKRRNAETESDKIFSQDQNVKTRLDRRIAIMQQYQDDLAAVFSRILSGEAAAIREAEAKIIAGDTTKDWDAQKKRAEANIQSYALLFRERYGEAAAQTRTFVEENKFIGGGKKDDLEKLFDRLGTALTSARSKLAGVTERLKEGQPEVEKFKQGLMADFGPRETWPEHVRVKIDELLPILAQLDEANTDLKNKMASDAAFKSLERTLAQTAEEAKIFAEAVEGGLTEVPNNRVRRFRRTLEGLRATVIAAEGDLTEFDRIAKMVLADTQNITAGEKILEINRELGEIEASRIVNARERFDMEEQLEQQRFRSLLLDIQDASQKDILIGKYEMLKEARRQAFEDNQPIRRLALEWEDVMGNMEKASADFINKFTDELVDGLAEGKLSFSDFAKHVLKELLKIIIRGLIARAILAVFGGGSINPDTAIDMGAFDPGGVYNSAMGNVMTKDGPMPLKRYAKGGIATKPQVSIFGEGSQPEAYVPLPDGRTIPVTMTGSKQQAQAPMVEVNVINESGQPLNAEQQGSKFDGQKMILDVVLTAASSPGNFRDGMKAAMRR